MRGIYAELSIASMVAVAAEDPFSLSFFDGSGDVDRTRAFRFGRNRDADTSMSDALIRIGRGEMYVPDGRMKP